MKHHRAKLTDDMVAEMRTLRASDPTRWTYAELARHSGSSESTARDIVLNRTRMDVIVMGVSVSQDATRDRFDIAAELRQKVLDFINEKGRVNNSQIVKHFQITCDHAFRTTKKMHALGELEKQGAGQAAQFSALTKTSTPASVLRFNSYDKRDKNIREYHDLNEASKPRKSSKAGHYIHTPGHYPIEGHTPGRPLSNQEGIGSGRSRVYVGSTAGMV